MCMAAAAAAHYCTKGKRYKLQKGIHSLEKAFHNYSHPCLSFLSNSCKKSPLLFEEKKSWSDSPFANVIYLGNDQAYVKHH